MDHTLLKTLDFAPSPHFSMHKALEVCATIILEVAAIPLPFYQADLFNS